jgi:tRNA(fMet)-specific endonuclease VapC
MSAILLLDTNIISHIMRQPGGLAARRADLIDTDERLCTSVIVQFELRFGLEKNPSKRLQTSYDVTMAGIDVLPLDSSAAAEYARIRATLESMGKPIGANDLLIAAHALALDATLVTDNEAEFRRVPGLKVENWLVDT